MNRVHSGREKIALALRDMAGLSRLAADAESRRRLKGVNILGCVTVTPETAVFITALTQLGANITWCSDNRFASDDDVVAALRADGLPVFARSGMSAIEHHQTFRQASETAALAGPDLHVVDDGADVTSYLVESGSSVLAKVNGITEQTTCGVHTIARLYASRALDVPTIDINQCFLKRKFDNYYGVQESVVRGLMVATGMQLAGKQIAIFGYGEVGHGAAGGLRSFGARVVIVERDLLRLAQAHFDGFGTMDPVSAVATSDVCITATGEEDVIGAGLLDRARDHLIVANIGHGTAEYDAEYLLRNSSVARIGDYIDACTMPSGKTIYSLCSGALVNLIAGRGNPPAAMSLTFTLHILGHLELRCRADRYRAPEIHRLPRSVELEAARWNFPELQDKLSI